AIAPSRSRQLPSGSPYLLVSGKPSDALKRTARMSMQTATTTPLADRLLDDLRSLLGERLSTAPAVREQHGKDVSFHEGFPPDAVAFARSTEEVQAIVKLCAEHKTPIVPFGTDTSLEGHIAALKGGV